MFNSIGTTTKEMASATILARWTPYGLRHFGPVWGVVDLTVPFEQLTFLLTRIFRIIDVGGGIARTRGEFLIRTSFFMAD